MCLSSNIPSLILYASIFSALLKIVQCTLRLTDFVPKASQLHTRMLTYGGNKTNVLQQIKKRHSKDTLKHSPIIVKHMTKIIN